MINLLIVDDEAVVVNSLKNRVDWEGFSITAVYTANSAEQARSIMRENPIDILLCDIEMPRESGLDLLDWARLEYQDIVCIFLTCHEEFRFVKRALELRSFDYILKPIPYDELEEILKESVGKVLENRVQAEVSRYGKLWDNNKAVIIEGFWKDLVRRLIPLQQELLQSVLDKRNIPIQANHDFLPVLFHLLKDNQRLDEKHFGILRGLLETAFLDFADSVQIFVLSASNFVAILSIEKEGDLLNLFHAGEQCSQCMEQFRKETATDMAVYIGRVAKMHELPDMVDELQELKQEHVVKESKVFFTGSRGNDNAFEDIRDIARWKRLFEQQKNEFLIGEIQHFLSQITDHGRMDRGFLMRFEQDFLQMTYMILQDNGISAHKLFSDKLSIKILEESLLSVTGMLKMVEHVVLRSTEYIAKVQEPESIAEKTKKYIREHIAEELNRDDIANNVYLNSDYLSRLFKKETGISLTDHITKERMKMAEEILLSSRTSTYSIAERVGYSSYSYFAKIFKKYYHMTPNEFRALQDENKK